MNTYRIFLLSILLAVVFVNHDALWAEDNPSVVSETPAANVFKTDAISSMGIAAPAKVKSSNIPASVEETLTLHSLNDIQYKVERAVIDLENLKNDLGGHRTPAVNYLKQAMQELEKAK